MSYEIIMAPAFTSPGIVPVPIDIHAQIQGNIHINGYMGMEFEKKIEDKGKGDKIASFDADLIDLVWNIKATDRLRIATDLTWEHGVASEDDRGEVFHPWMIGRRWVR